MINQKLVLGWFTGKARDRAGLALELLGLSIEQGYWLPGARRTVIAGLNKATVAQKYARIAGAGMPHDAHMILLYGFEQIARHSSRIHLEALAPTTRETVERYLLDFGPVATAVAQLDATIPPPVITQLGASPTVTTTLEALGLAANVATIRVCPIRWVRVERMGADGKMRVHHVGYFDFPAGTVHNASRYDHTEHNDQCQACGHAIRKPTNWVPMLIDNRDGVPHSLWVGKDCAETLFGVQVKGSLELAVGPGAQKK